MAMVTRMDALFLIDRDARQRALSTDERLSATAANTPRNGCEEIREACLALVPSRCCRKARWARRRRTP